jgi:hypothetical protein
MPRLERGEAADPAALEAFFAPPPDPPAPVVIPPTPAGTKTFSPSQYPVRVAYAAQSLVSAIISLLIVLDVVSLTEAQVAALMTVYAATLPLIGAIVGSKVTPTAKLEQGAAQ